MSFVIIPKKDPKKLQNLWAPSLTTVHISLVGWDQGGEAVSVVNAEGAIRSTRRRCMSEMVMKIFRILHKRKI